MLRPSAVMVRCSVNVTRGVSSDIVLPLEAFSTNLFNESPSLVTTISSFWSKSLPKDKEMFVGGGCRGGVLICEEDAVDIKRRHAANNNRGRFSIRDRPLIEL